MVLFVSNRFGINIVSSMQLAAVWQKLDASVSEKRERCNRSSVQCQKHFLHFLSDFNYFATGQFQLCHPLTTTATSARPHVRQSHIIRTQIYNDVVVRHVVRPKTRREWERSNNKRMQCALTKQIGNVSNHSRWSTTRAERKMGPRAHSSNVYSLSFV